MFLSLKSIYGITKDQNILLGKNHSLKICRNEK